MSASLADISHNLMKVRCSAIIFPDIAENKKRAEKFLPVTLMVGKVNIFAFSG